MRFEVGETVVYPHHGAAKITKVAKKDRARRNQRVFNPYGHPV